MAENLGHRTEICGNSGRTIWPKAAVGLGLLDNMQERCHILNSGSNLALVRCCEGFEALMGKV
jgi:hypothetical protein